MSLFHSTGSSPIEARRLFTSPYCSEKMLLKISATAAGVTTYGSSTLSRQNVLARRLRSRTAAMKVAATSCGIADSRKMLKVLNTEFQNQGSTRAAA